MHRYDLNLGLWSDNKKMVSTWYRLKNYIICQFVQPNTTTYRPPPNVCRCCRNDMTVTDTSMGWSTICHVPCGDVLPAKLPQLKSQPIPGFAHWCSPLYFETFGTWSNHWNVFLQKGGSTTAAILLHGPIFPNRWTDHQRKSGWEWLGSCCNIELHISTRPFSIRSCNIVLKVENKDEK
jgi:hypothetical protein